MKHRTTHIALAAIGLGLTSPAFATNGDNLIGIGPISRALGGTGIAAPQDAISAVFSNPAAMCISPACSAPQADFALTAFMPEVNASLDLGGMKLKGSSKDTVYPIPAMGFSFPVGGDTGRWRAGFAAYGVSGLGVNYKGTDLAKSFPGGPFEGYPFIATPYTELQIMKIAPSIAYSVTPDLSFGLSLHTDYATLDLNNGTKHDWALGFQLGMVWKPVQNISLGLTYVSPQKTTFDNVFDFTGDRVADALALEAPQQVGLGVAWTGMEDRLLVEVDGKWLNWADSDGYDMFEWDDQWTIGIGVQYEVIPEQLWLRAGYNYGKNPVSQNTISGAGPNSNYYNESMRVIGFPAIVEHHLGMGFGYQFKDNLILNVAYMHAFEKGFSESGVAPDGMTPVTMKSTLSEDSIDIGLTWRY